MSEHKSENEPLLTDEEVAALPLDERMMIALSEAGLDESDVERALDVVLPLVADDLRELAGQIEWTNRSMTFYRAGGSESRLHRSGQDVRDYADRLSRPGEQGAP